MDEDSDLQQLSTDMSRATSQESPQFDRASYFESQYDSLRKQHDLLEEQYKENTEHLIKALAQVKTSEIRYSRLEKEKLALQGIVNRLTPHVSPRGVPSHQADPIRDLDTLKIQHDALDDIIESSAASIKKLSFEGSMLKLSVTNLEQRLEAAKHRMVLGTNLPGHLSTSLPDHTASDIPTSDSENQCLERPASIYHNRLYPTSAYSPDPHMGVATFEIPGGILSHWVKGISLQHSEEGPV
ncbi:hypothetical protein GALMADRAFT_1298163 [Galerina marginata CBS 339.88]|uniref:Uncharacterized protein n=1 Tax=Galerina marginata (strain CBS 339.88) TaxID=685588 RepID=A0A067T6R7_GALM3|nr:hypothetical protein GALMADRAFT_1298163 [Galerina marginata CBS 339.88]